MSWVQADGVLIPLAFFVSEVNESHASYAHSFV